MLWELSIHNFALIEDLTIEFGPGLNVLTGETGAGKSIIVDAVSLVLGGRASTDFIREPAEKARIEGVFELPLVETLGHTLEELGVEVGEDKTLVMSREISRNGRNLCRINGRTMTLSNYRRVGQYLIDLHGQHEHQSLLNPERHLELLDSFAGEELLTLREQVQARYRELQTVLRDLNHWQKKKQEIDQRQDLLMFQVQEIESANLAAGEEDELQQEKTILQNAEKLVNGVAKAYQWTYGGTSQQTSAFDLLSQAINELRSLGNLDPTLLPIIYNLETALYQAEEAAHELRRYLDRIEADPDRLEIINERLNLIRQLKRKYGNSIEEIRQYGQEIAKELEEVTGYGNRIDEFQQKQVHLEEEYRTLARSLSERRKQVATVLAEGINQGLGFLGMSSAQFTIDFQWREQPAVNGQDEIEFLLSPNPGEPLKPLARIASGGELSRIMLVLKTLLAQADRIPTLIFDEIDTGIGGRTLEAVAIRLSEVAISHQVICVTHAAQIASRADAHLFIEKKVSEGRTHTQTSRLSAEERITEISRMLGGNTDSPVSRKHAIEMLKRARGRK